MTLKRLCALASSTLLLVGCSAALPNPAKSAPLSARPTVTASSSKATTATAIATTTTVHTVTSTITQTPAAPTIKTQIIGINVMDAEGKLKPEYTFNNKELASTLNIDCGQYSPVGLSYGTYYCSPTAAGLQACWKDPNPPAGTRHLLCIRSYQDTEVIVIEPTRLDTTPKVAPLPMPLNLELADGSIWIHRNGGAGNYTYPGYYISYYCRSGCGPYTSGDKAILVYENSGLTKNGDTWYAEVGETGATSSQAYPIPTKIAVKTAWFITNEPV